MFTKIILEQNIDRKDLLHTLNKIAQFVLENNFTAEFKQHTDRHQFAHPLDQLITRYIDVMAVMLKKI